MDEAAFYQAVEQTQNLLLVRWFEAFEMVALNYLQHAHTGRDPFDAANYRRIDVDVSA